MQNRTVEMDTKQISSEHEQLLRRLETTTTELQEVMQKYKEAQRLARTDALTGLLNRRAFEEEVNRHFSEFHRYGIETAVILMDIDHFKHINDRLGHATGDRVLKAVAKTVRPVLRTSDVIARWGGEEFIVGLQHMQLSAAVEVAERIRESVERMTGDERAPLPAVTASVGVASLGLRDISPDVVIDRADKALYQAKEQGRNRTHAAGCLITVAH